MLTTILGVPAHGLFVGLGVLAAVVVFVSEARRRGHTDDRLLIVVTGALVGGALLMRLGTWLQHVDLRPTPPSPSSGPTATAASLVGWSVRGWACTSPSG